MGRGGEGVGAALVEGCLGCAGGVHVGGFVDVGVNVKLKVGWMRWEGEGVVEGEYILGLGTIKVDLFLRIL